MRSNRMKVLFESKSENEAFARIAVAAFITPLDPTIQEMTDIKTAVSEAVTNCIVHAYGDDEGIIEIEAQIEDDVVTVTVKDNGVGIKDIGAAMEPLYTTKPELERSGMGFSFMEIFMDTLEVTSNPGKGTTVKMSRKLGRDEQKPAQGQ